MLPPIIRRRHPLTVKAGIRRITVRETHSRMAHLESRSTPMEFAALFLAVTVVMVIAWWGTRTLALALFAATLVASIATYLHHASDVLKLSF
jgi:hypothetical protein